MAGLKRYSKRKGLKHLEFCKKLKPIKKLSDTGTPKQIYTKITVKLLRTNDNEKIWDSSPTKITPYTKEKNI